MNTLKKGFTLLEMVIVIAVISILFLLTVPNIQKVLSIVNDKGCQAMLKVVDASVIQYQLEYGQTPSSTYDLVQAGLLSEKQTECNHHAITIIDGQARLE